MGGLPRLKDSKSVVSDIGAVALDCVVDSNEERVVHDAIRNEELVNDLS